MPAIAITFTKKTDLAHCNTSKKIVIIFKSLRYTVQILCLCLYCSRSIQLIGKQHLLGEA